MEKIKHWTNHRKIENCLLSKKVGGHALLFKILLVPLNHFSVWMVIHINSEGEKVWIFFIMFFDSILLCRTSHHAASIISFPCPFPIVFKFESPNRIPIIFEFGGRSFNRRGLFRRSFVIFKMSKAFGHPIAKIEIEHGGWFIFNQFFQLLRFRSNCGQLGNLGKFLSTIEEVIYFLLCKHPSQRGA